MKNVVLGVFGGLLLAVSALAAEPAPVSWFVALDQNRDGGISLGELQAMRYERFRVIDSNQDNVLSADEVGASRTWQARILRSDENVDGRLSLAEFEKAGRDRFAVIDIDGDGRISAHEALNFQRKVRKYAPVTPTAG